MASELILESAEREIAILVSSGQVTVTYSRCVPGEQIAGPHVHRLHTDAFYVLEGALTFEVGAERNIVTIAAGGLVAAPPGVAHSFRTDGEVPVRWLTIHAVDGGFAAFLRGVRDGVDVAWDIAPVPPGGGLSASAAVVAQP